MFRKMTISFLALTLCIAQANASARDDLKKAFDELTYSLSVEWNQTDRVFHDEQVAKFNQKIHEFQAQGLSNADMLAFAANQVKDQNLAQEVRATMVYIQINKLPADQALKLVRDTMAKTHSNGASWSSDAFLTSWGPLLLLAVLVAAFGFNGHGYNENTPNCYYQEVCGTNPVRDGWGNVSYDCAEVETCDP